MKSKVLILFTLLISVSSLAIELLPGESIIYCQEAASVSTAVFQINDALAHHRRHNVLRVFADRDYQDIRSPYSISAPSITVNSTVMPPLASACVTVTKQ